MEFPASFGKYELLERIATGGMAEVYLARSFGIAGFEKRLVIKRIRAELAKDPQFVQLFIHEARISVQLNHANVVQVYDLGRVGEAWYMAMEHLHGRDLTRLVKTLRARDERLPIPVSVAITAELLRGLHYAHTRPDPDGNLLGLVHRDVSPHNVVITFDGSAKLVDFGVARLMNTVQSETEGIRDGPGGGKYAYMSPEQAEGGAFDHRTDVYSAGIVLWELIAGHRLFQDPDPSEKLRRVREAVIPDPRDEGVELEEGLWQVVRKALAKDPTERYASAALFEEDLRAWLFKNNEPAGNAEIAKWMAHTFPADARRPQPLVDLRSLASDLLDLGHTDPTPTISNGPRPGRLPASDAERKPVTSVVIDVDGLTDLSMRLEPEDLFRRQFRLLRRVAKTADRLGGRILRAVDDQIIVLFGVPLTREEDGVSALEFASSLSEDAKALREQGIPVSFAVGVHQGEVTGAVRGRRRKYLPRGDTTRLARRLSGLADHGQILCSDAARNSVREAFIFGPPIELANRGGKSPINAWPMLDRKRGLRVTRSGSWLRRGQEVDVLREALVALDQGKGSALSLTGPVGAGKSRFLREIRDLASKRRVPFYVGRCAPRGVDPPMEPFRDWIRQVTGADANGLDPVEAVATLSELGLTAEDTNLIARFMGAPGKPPRAQAVTVVLSKLVKALSKVSPVVFALEDAERLSSAETEHYCTLVERTVDVPILWLVSHREPVTGAFEALGPVVALGAFDRRDQGRLLANKLGVDDISDDLLEFVSRTCEGNALYLEEMLRFLVESGQVEVHNGVAEYVANIRAPSLPGSLNALVSSRLDALDSASKGVLQLAATIGADFPLSLLAEAAGMDDVRTIVDDLTRHHLLVQDGAETWAFVSELVRRSVLHGILGVQRRDQHLLVAAAMETLYADNLEPWHETLAAHCAAGGRVVDAARYVHMAGQRLEAAQFIERALSAYSRGLRWLEAAPESPSTWDARTQGEAMLRFRIGNLLILRGDPKRGERALQLALDISSDASLPWIEVRAHVALGRSYMERGKPVLAKAHLLQAHAMLQFEDDDALSVACLEARAALAFQEGRNGDALTLWSDALAVAGSDPSARARCLLGLANQHLRAGRGDDAAPLLELALAAATDASDRILLGRAQNNRGLVALIDKRFDEALLWFRRALQTREGIGYPRGIIINHHNIGDAHFGNEDMAKAWVAFERSYELATDIGWEGGQALNDVYLGYIHGQQAYEEGITRLQAARAIAKRLQDTETSATGAWLAGRLHAEQNNLQAAADAWAEGLAEAEAYELTSLSKTLQDGLDGLPRD